VNVEFVQDNQSQLTSLETVQGLQSQAQAKLVRFTMSATNRAQLYILADFAHGFVTI